MADPDLRIEDQLADREALRRIPGLSTELEDISEVEYRQVRLERVVLVGVWTHGSALMHNVRCRNSPGWPRPPDRWCSKAWCSAGQSPILRRMSDPARPSSCATSCRPRSGHGDL